MRPAQPAALWRPDDGANRRRAPPRGGSRRLSDWVRLVERPLAHGWSHGAECRKESTKTNSDAGSRTVYSPRTERGERLLFNNNHPPTTGATLPATAAWSAIRGASTSCASAQSPPGTGSLANWLHLVSALTETAAAVPDREQSVCTWSNTDGHAIAPGKPLTGDIASRQRSRCRHRRGGRAATSSYLPISGCERGWVSFRNRVEGQTSTQSDCRSDCD